MVRTGRLQEKDKSNKVIQITWTEPQVLDTMFLLRHYISAKVLENNKSYFEVSHNKLNYWVEIKLLG